MTGWSITLILCSWAIGRKNIRHKTVVAFGPFRFSVHRELSAWKEIINKKRDSLADIKYEG